MVCDKSFNANEIPKAPKVELSVVLDDGGDTVDLLPLRIIEPTDDLAILVELQDGAKLGNNMRENMAEELGDKGPDRGELAQQGCEGTAVVVHEGDPEVAV